MYFQTHNNRQVADDKRTIADRVTHFSECRSLRKRVAVEHLGLQSYRPYLRRLGNFAIIRSWLFRWRLPPENATYLGFDRLLSFRYLRLVFAFLVIGA